MRPIPSVRHARRRLARLLALVLCTAPTACGLGYTEPVLADEEITFEPQLVGTWDDTGSTAWVEVAAFAVPGWEEVSTVAPRMYVIAFHDEDGDVNRFEGLYGTFDRWRLMQVQPAPPEPDLRGTLEQNLILNLYGFVEISALGPDRFAMRSPDPDSVIAAVRRAGGRVPFIEVDERVVVTASRDALRPFLREVLARPEAWGDTTWFVRRR